MSRAWPHLSLFPMLLGFLLVGVLYLTVFASQSKIYAEVCGRGPDGTYASWCATNGQAIACRGAPSCGTNPNREDSYAMCVNCCNSTGQFTAYNQCTPSAPPPPPSCSSRGGYCQYYTAGCGAAGPVSGATCNSSFLICCRPTNACESASVAGKCVSASSQGVAPCPSGMSYNTSISCGSAYLVCCAPNSPPAPPPPPPPPRYDINGYVWVDHNRNDVRDNGEPYYTGSLTVRLSGAASATTNTDVGTDGPYSFFDYLAGNYTVSITVPSGYVATTPTSRSFYLNSNRYNENFGIVPVYSISGSVYNDVDRDYAKDSGEGKTWSGGVSFSRSPTYGSVSTNSTNGTFSMTGLYAGTYTVRLTSSIPSGYILRHPVNGPPPAFSVTVGSGCTYSPLHPNSAGRATCNARGDISNLNFVITNSIPWWQTLGFDVRIDTGITNIIPSSPLYQPYSSVIDN